MCKVGIHLCNHILIPTLAIFPGRWVNSEARAFAIKRSPALSSLISVGSSPLFVTTMFSFFLFFLFFQLSDAEVVETLVQLISLSKQLMVPQSTREIQLCQSKQATAGLISLTEVNICAQVLMFWSCMSGII